MADNPQQTINELKELVVSYTLQETVEPIKGLGKYVAFGLAGGILMGMGIMFLAIGALRYIQGWGFRGRHFNGNMSWAPYAIVVVGSLLIAALIWWGRGKRKRAKGYQ